MDCAESAIRNIPLFVVVTIPFAINNISSLGITNRISDRLQKKWSKTVYVLHITLLLGFVLLLIDNGYYFLQNRPMKMGVGIDNTIQSVTCSEFMIANEINGKVLNDFNVGSWLEWHWDKPVYIDGRLEVMQEDFFSEYNTSHQRGGLQKLVSKYGPTAILFDYTLLPVWHQQLLQMPNYKMVMEGNKAALYVKKSAYPHIEAFDFRKWLESKNLTHQLSEKKVYELLRTEPLNFRGILYHALTLQVKYLHSEYMKTGIFAYRNGQYAVAERLYLKYLEETKGGDVNVFVNLGSLYMRQKQYNKARLCYIQARKIIPDNPLVKKRLKVLNSRIAPKFY